MDLARGDACFEAPSSCPQIASQPARTRFMARSLTRKSIDRWNMERLFKVGQIVKFRNNGTRHKRGELAVVRAISGVVPRRLGVSDVLFLEKVDPMTGGKRHYVIDASHCIATGLQSPVTTR